MPKSNEVGRIWIWQSTYQKKKEVKPDLVLPDGFLFEGQVEHTYRHICMKNNLTNCLPNQDLVIGPPMENAPGTEDKEKEQNAHNRKAFFTDMKYLRYAMLSGTIVLEDHPVPPHRD